MWESFKFKFYDYNCYSYYYYSDIYYFGPILLVVIIFHHSQYFSLILSEKVPRSVTKILSWFYIMIIFIDISFFSLSFMHHTLFLNVKLYLCWTLFSYHVVVSSGKRFILSFQLIPSVTYCNFYSSQNFKWNNLNSFGSESWLPCGSVCWFAMFCVLMHSFGKFLFILLKKKGCEKY